MATLLIKGDPDEIGWLWDELGDRHYLGSEFVVERVEWNALAASDLLEACKLAANRPSEVQAMMRREGFVIDDLKDRWQKFAFTLYTMLVGNATQAQTAIDQAEVEG